MNIRWIKFTLFFLVLALIANKILNNSELTFVFSVLAGFPIWLIVARWQADFRRFIWRRI